MSYIAQLSAWLPEHEKTRFIEISIHSTSAKNVVNNELLRKCPDNKRLLEFPKGRFRLDEFLRAKQVFLLSCELSAGTNDGSIQFKQ